jgi:hypothetical protein
MKMGYCLIVDSLGVKHKFKSYKANEIFKFIGKRKNVQEVRIEWKDTKKKGSK